MRPLPAMQTVMVFLTLLAMLVPQAAWAEIDPGLPDSLRMRRQVERFWGEEELESQRAMAQALTPPRQIRAFLEAKARFEQATGGWVIVFSNHPDRRWGGVNVLTGDQLRQAVEEVLRRIPNEYPYTRLVAKRVLDTIILGLGAPSKRRLGAFTVEVVQFDRPEPWQALRIHALHRLRPFLPMVWLSASDTVYSPMMRLGKGAAFVIPLNKDLRVGEARQRGPEVVEVLSGASFSQAERIVRPDGRFAIRKIASRAHDGGKLWEEAYYLTSLRREQGLEMFPEVFQVTQDGDQVTVVMEDLQRLPLSSFFYGDYGETVPHKVLWAHALKVYRDLIGPFYSQRVRETPRDFVQRYYLDKIEGRLQQARDKAPGLAEMLDADVIRVEHEVVPRQFDAEYLPGFRQLRPFVEAIGATGIWSPPYLAQQHGDLNFSNILVDPTEYVFSGGELRSYKLIDPKYLPAGNDYLYDFAKLIADFVGHLMVAKLDEIYGYDAVHEPEHPVPTFREFLNDEEGNMHPFLGTDKMRVLIGRWLRSQDDFFGLETGSAWKARLQFTVASLLLGQPPFHLRDDGQERAVRTIYINALKHLYHVVGQVMEGEFDDGLPSTMRAQLDQVRLAMREQWEALNETVQSYRLAEAVRRIGNELLPRGLTDLGPSTTAEHAL